MIKYLRLGMLSALLLLVFIFFGKAYAKDYKVDNESSVPANCMAGFNKAKENPSAMDTIPKLGCTSNSNFILVSDDGNTRLYHYSEIPAHSAQSFSCKVLPESFCSASDDSGVYGLLNLVINILTGIIGLVVVAIIIISGIQLISSAGNPDAIASAKKRIFTAVLGLVLLISMRAILALIGIKVV